MAGQQLPDDLLAWLRDLDRRLVALERSPQLTSASIKDGALTIYNAAGLPVLVLGKQSTGRYGLSAFNAAGQRTLELGELASSRNGLEVPDPTSGVAQVRVGQLAAGGYGLEAVSGGATVTLDTLAFRAAAAVVNTDQTTTSTSYTDLATAGPAAAVTIGSSGRAIVILTARTQTGSAGGEGGYMGFAISGATTAAPADDQSMLVASPGAMADAVRASAAFLVTGLTAGSNTFTAKYRSISGSLISFKSRNLIVLPF